MLKVVIICALALSCHLIVAVHSDITDDDGDDLKNNTSVELLTTLQPEARRRVEGEVKGQKEQSFCSRPPGIDGVISPDLEGEEYHEGTIISYQCKFGYVSRSSGSLLSICRVQEGSEQAEWTPLDTTCVPRSCGDPGYVVNGRRVGNLFTFPNSVKFECVEGYKLKGLKDRYCQANGEWSGSLPTCVLIRCPVPSNPINGQVRYSSLDYGTELEYECDKGFTLPNYKPRICVEDGIWSNDEPECTEITCRIPENPSHGSVQIYDEPKVGALVFYSCDDGATLLGASTSKCLNSGDWTFDPPKCLRSCSVPNIQNGELGRVQWKPRHRQDFISVREGENVKHHEIVTIRCKDGYSAGYKTTGSSQEVECNDGTWSEPLICHLMICRGQPPPIQHGSPVIESRIQGHGIWYRCNDGYQKVKGGKVVCKYGEWQGPTPVCADYRCYMEELNYPGLVKPKENFIQHREHFNLICAKAYKVSSWKKHVSCFEGKWDVTKNPCTIKTCDEQPPLLENGKPTEFARINGSIVDYICYEGYVLEGHSTVQCAFDEWVGMPPVCNPAIEDLVTTTPSESENNNVTTISSNDSSNSLGLEDCFCTFDYNKYYLQAYWRDIEIESVGRIKKGERVLFSCKYPSTDIVWPNGLRFYEKVELVCDKCLDWRMQDLPQCEIRAPGGSFIYYDHQLKIQPGGVIEVPQSERISIACINPWLQPRWNTFPTNKLRFEVNPVPVIEARFFREDIIIDEMDYEHVGRYECVAVTSDKQYLKPVVIDLKIDGLGILCPVLSTETNQGSFDIVYSNDRKVDSKAFYTCKDPLKKVIGSNERICLANGKWSSSFPACEDIRCPLLNESNAFLITYSNNRKINSVAFYYCNTARQRLIGSSNRTCLHSGQWSGTNPVCEDVTCPAFLTYNGLSVTYTRGMKVGSTVNFTCTNHATLVGSPFAVCLHNGTWSHQRPSCEMMEILCPKIDGKGIFTIKYSNGRKINSTALFFCKAPNKKVAGCNFMTCQQNGEWSGDYPACVDYVTCDLFANSPNLNILYTDAGQVESVATFQCIPPTILIGNSFARCLSNGTWSHTLPTCAPPNCSIETLSISLPEAIYPDMINVTSEYVTPGSELPLMCEDYLVLTGSEKAVCNLHGKWEFNDVQCIPACRVDKDETSLLIVEPVKDYYRFGEFILLSCPPGQKLTSEVVRMMCLGRTWSDTLPACDVSEEPNLSGSSQPTTKSH